MVTQASAGDWRSGRAEGVRRAERKAATRVTPTKFFPIALECMKDCACRSTDDGWTVHDRQIVCARSSWQLPRAGIVTHSADVFTMSVLSQLDTGKRPDRVPAFQNAAVSLSTAWDVWLSSGATSAHLQQIAHLRLQAIVAFARQRSPFYRERYRDLPPGPWALNQLPVLTKQQLMANFDAVITDRTISTDAVQRFLCDP